MFDKIIRYTRHAQLSGKFRKPPPFFELFWMIQRKSNLSLSCQFYRIIIATNWWKAAKRFSQFFIIFIFKIINQVISKQIYWAILLCGLWLNFFYQALSRQLIPFNQFSQFLIIFIFKIINQVISKYIIILLTETPTV